MTPYHENRDVLRSMIEAGTVEERFRDIWWQKLTRNVDRFVFALKKSHGIKNISGIPVRTILESMGSLEEQSASTWFV